MSTPIRSRTFFVSVFASLLAACGGNVVYEGEGTTGTGNGSSVDGSGATVGASGGGASVGAGGAEMGTSSGATVTFSLVTTNPIGACSAPAGAAPGDTVFLIVANAPITCSDATPSDFTSDSCGSPFVWELCAAVPASELGALPAYAPSSSLMQVTTGGSCGAGCCGSCCATTTSEFGPSARLRIDAASAQSVAFTITGTDAVDQGWGAPDGAYAAKRCP